MRYQRLTLGTVEHGSLATSAPGILLALISTFVSHSFAAESKQMLTPEAALMSVRILGNQHVSMQPREYVTPSPDGKRYVVRLVRADRERDGVWVDILSGGLDSLQGAEQISTAASLFTSARGCFTTALSCADQDPRPTNIIRWMNNDTVALLSSNASDIRQVVSVDVKQKAVSPLTTSDTSVLSFDVGPHNLVVYNSLVPVDDTTQIEEARRAGFVIPRGTSGFDILRGSIGSVTEFDRLSNRWYVQGAGGNPRPLTIDGLVVDRTHPHLRRVRVSPDGRFAITTAAVSSVPIDWSSYRSAQLQTILMMNRAPFEGRLALRHIVFDLERGTARSLWAAPAVPGDFVWAPNSRSVVIAPACLPHSSNSDVGRACAAAAEVDISTGAYRPLSLDLRSNEGPFGRAVVSLNWHSSNEVSIETVETDGTDRKLHYLVRSGQQWKVTSKKEHTGPRRVHVEVQESLNVPPRIFARAGATRVEILDPNSGFTSKYKLGRVARVQGPLSRGGTWKGLLYFPADYSASRRYPTVIQSIHGAPSPADEFNLYGNWGGSGMGLGPSVIPVYLGQILASQDIAVLRLWLESEGQGVEEGPVRQHAYEDAAKYLVSIGLANAEKIALVGYSRAGFHVEYTLINSDRSFATAVSNDNYDPSYLQSALNDWSPLDATINGGSALGPALAEWLKRAPGFNAQRIEVPLLMVGQTPSEAGYIMSRWEVFSRLRALGRPVEMYVMPDIARFPSHEVQSPRQVLAIQHHVEDWLRFWIGTDVQRTSVSPTNRDRWNQMKAQALSLSQSEMRVH